MSSATLSLTTTRSDLDVQLSCPAIPTHPLPNASESARLALATYLQSPADLAAWENLVGALLKVRTALADLDRHSPLSEIWESVVTLSLELAHAGVHERLAAMDESAVETAHDWRGLLTLMLLRPAWACLHAPALDAVPERQRDAYAAWLFMAPLSFVALGQADRYADFVERHLGELVRWADVNPEADLVRTALKQYQSRSDFSCLMLSGSALRHHALLHGRLLQQLARSKTRVPMRFAAPREGRRLRLGFVVPAFDGSLEMRSTIPLLGHLDCERFELVIFALSSCDSRWEDRARKYAAQFHVLPADLDQQVAIIGSSSIDVLVFAEEIAGETHATAKLAAHRLAPLQVVSSAHQKCTTGLPTIDLFVLGNEIQRCDETQLTERLALTWGPARVLEDGIVTEQPGAAWSRADLDLPVEASIFVAACDWCGLTPETQHAWARLLAQVPGSRLVVQHFGGTDVDPATAARHCATFDRTLSAHGVDADRALVIPAAPPSRSALQSLLAVGDIYLDTLPSAGDTLALAALKVGVPVVTLQGATLRSGYVAATLRAIGCDQLVAGDLTGYHAIAAELARAPGQVTAAREQIRAAMTALPAVFDSMAACEAFSDIVEFAYDELVAVGPAAFVTNRKPLRVPLEPKLAASVETAEQALAAGDFFKAEKAARLVLRSQPNHPAARATLGRALLGQDKIARAVDYLGASVKAPDAGAPRWFSFAQALHRQGRGAEAGQALQTGQRLASSNADAPAVAAKSPKRRA
jgi:predicted O-linked N-acetylglucosamine transferase (SPINDLY family)